MAEQVKFVDRFVGRVELGTWLEAADVFVAPSLDLDRTVSGTLAYAMGAGKAIVSTPSAYASEMLAGGRGRLVDSRLAHELSPRAITELLTDADASSRDGAAGIRAHAAAWCGGKSAASTVASSTGRRRHRRSGLPQPRRNLAAVVA